MKALLPALVLSVLYFSPACIAAPQHKGRSQEIRALSDVVKSCVFRHDTDHPIFHGCIDWHSAVHGHWALLWSADALRDRQQAALILARFSRDKMAREYKLISGSKHFEMPYGRAWFLQLALDTERVHGSRALRPLADHVYQTLLTFSRNNGGSIRANDYDNASWYLYQTYRWARFSGDREQMAVLEKHILRRFQQPPSWPAYGDIRGFFDAKALAALLLSEIPDSSARRHLLASYRRDRLEPLRPPFATAHRGGLNYARSWGLWSLYRVTSKSRYADAARKHRTVMFNHLHQWASDYRRFGHWVAQFGLFSHHLESAIEGG